MDQIKIGLFIAKCRKEKGLTQQELADKLHVTDRAISNWETGRRMPDISFYKPLCEILDISVNELIHGEHIAKEKFISTTDETLIKALHQSVVEKRKSRNAMILLIALLLIIILAILSYHLSRYPKIDIHNIVLSPSDPDKKASLEKQFSYKLDQQEYDIYYYGIENFELCDEKGCYFLKNALDMEQTSIKKIQAFLDKEYALGNISRMGLYDGGTLIYENNQNAMIFCNTLEGNKDVYFGTKEMILSLQNSYCQKESLPPIKFIRTYHVSKITENTEDENSIYVTLKPNNGEETTVKISKRFSITVGLDYEFSFYTLEKFADTISNIFEYSVLVSVYETSKSPEEQINEPIYVNEKMESTAELNEAENVVMEIKEGTLTNKKATIVITDLSGKDHTYGDYYRIDKLKDGTWQEVKEVADNAMWNDIGYGVDREGKLELEINWEWLYGTLPKGRYRIVKDVLEGPENKKLYFSTEFTLE